MQRLLHNLPSHHSLPTLPQVKSWCSVELRKFGNPAYPKHVTENLKIYAFKLLIIQVGGAGVLRLFYSTDHYSMCKLGRFLCKNIKYVLL